MSLGGTDLVYWKVGEKAPGRQVQGSAQAELLLPIAPQVGCLLGTLTV